MASKKVHYTTITKPELCWAVAGRRVRANCEMETHSGINRSMIHVRQTAHSMIRWMADEETISLWTVDSQAHDDDNDDYLISRNRYTLNSCSLVLHMELDWRQKSNLYLGLRLCLELVINLKIITRVHKRQELCLNHCIINNND